MLAAFATGDYTCMEFTGDSDESTLAGAYKFNCWGYTM